MARKPVLAIVSPCSYFFLSHIESFFLLFLLLMFISFPIRFLYHYVLILVDYTILLVSMTLLYSFSNFRLLLAPCLIVLVSLLLIFLLLLLLLLLARVPPLPVSLGFLYLFKSTSPVEVNFLSGVFLPLLSTKACEKSSQFLCKERCVCTGVRKPGNTCASPNAMI